MQNSKSRTIWGVFRLGSQRVLSQSDPPPWLALRFTARARTWCVCSTCRRCPSATASVSRPPNCFPRSSQGLPSPQRSGKAAVSIFPGRRALSRMVLPASLCPQTHKRRRESRLGPRRGPSRSTTTWWSSGTAPSAWRSAVTRRYAAAQGDPQALDLPLHCPPPSAPALRLKNPLADLPRHPDRHQGF